MKIIFLIIVLVSFYSCANPSEPDEIILKGSGLLESNSIVRNENKKYCFRQDGKSAVDFGCSIGDSVEFEATNYCRSSLSQNSNTYYCTLRYMRRIKWVQNPNCFLFIILLLIDELKATFTSEKLLLSNQDFNINNFLLHFLISKCNLPLASGITLQLKEAFFNFREDKWKVRLIISLHF